MANNYVLGNGTLDEFNGATLHKTLNYISRNQSTMDKQKCVNYFDIDIKAQDFCDAGGYQFNQVDITDELNKLNPKVADYEEQNFHILVQPYDDSNFHQNTDAQGYIYEEGANYSRYNNYGVRCIKMVPTENQHYLLYFKADSAPDQNIKVRLLCIYSPEMKGGETTDGNS